ncbi:hypothetical protein ACFWA9_34830 [Kitasatospora sp. NPDC059973]|uniref:hypothetical protein n=1 Tax=Kitasatospora sp. NPDC059973 TaxID=3347020 RepID=UPI0036AB2A79
MLLLGLLLMAAAGAFTGLLIADNLDGGPDYQVSVLGSDLVTLNSLAIFLAGVALALLFCLGLALIALARRTRPARLGAHRRGRPEGYPAPVEPVPSRPVAPATPVQRDDPRRPADPAGRPEPQTYALDPQALPPEQQAYPPEPQTYARDPRAVAPEQPQEEERTAEPGRGGRIRHLFGH